MRFEDDFERSKVPAWYGHYIPYGKLKTAIKVEHGRAKREGRRSNCSAILKDLHSHCQRVEKLYHAEYSRFSRLSSQTYHVKQALRNDNEFHSPTVAWARQQIFNESVSYVCNQGRNLILFAETNADAATRVADKLNRVQRIEGSSERLDLPNFPFSTHIEASATLYWTMKRDLLPLDVKVTTTLPDKEEMAEILEPFLSETENFSSQPIGSDKHRLSFIVEILAFHRNRSYSSEKTPATLGCVEQTADTFDDMLCSMIDTGILNNDELALYRGDGLGRSPLHYAAEHGLMDVISSFEELSKVPSAFINTFTQPYDTDRGQSSPLTLAICSGNKSAVEKILRMYRGQQASSTGQETLLPPHLALIALHKSQTDIIESLLESGTMLNKADCLGQTLLCAAVRLKPEMCSQILAHGADINLREPASGRTALSLACIRGDASLVKHFLDHGADPSAPDLRGWLPMEHAAYRGHFKILQLLASDDSYDAIMSISHTGSLSGSPLVRMNVMKDTHVPWIHGSSDAFKGTYVWIRLGNNDAMNPIKALALESTSINSPPRSNADEVLYSISLSVPGKPYIAREWRLPILGSNTNKPWLFETDSIDDLKLKWQLFENLVNSETKTETKTLVGSGIALVGTLNRGSRQNKESVVRDTTIPLLEPNTSSYVGSVTFSYFWSKPHPPPKHLRKPHFWEFGNGIGGHRGSGKNAINDKKLQIGENTAQSFSTAISHGASFLEFDVQLTKDLVPVVYHDFLISETGTDSTMHTLTYDQFKTISSVQGPRRNGKSRSNSMQSADYEYLDTFKERMDQTHFNKVTGFKANTRGNFIHEKSCSLDDVFRHLPASIPLNIELKYPMLFETADWDMELLAIKTDIFVDTVLDKVYEYAEGRTIVFSTFNPEICIALSTKQRSFPVFFLSKTAAPKGEVRSECIQQAVYFAKSWGLPGIVTECTPFIRCPRLIEYVKSAGLAVMTFGAGNSDKENVKIQFDGGINAVISDSIGAIKELRKIADTEDGPETVRVYP